MNVKEILHDAKLKDIVELDIKITQELREEGIVRDVARMLQELRQKSGLHPKDKIVIMLDAPAGTKDAIVKNEDGLKADVGADSIEYRKSDKFDAEAATKIEGQDLWIGIRKI